MLNSTRFKIIQLKYCPDTLNPAFSISISSSDLENLTKIKIWCDNFPSTNAIVGMITGSKLVVYIHDRDESCRHQISTNGITGKKSVNFFRPKKSKKLRFRFHAHWCWLHLWLEFGAILPFPNFENGYPNISKVSKFTQEECQGGYCSESIYHLSNGYRVGLDLQRTWLYTPKNTSHRTSVAKCDTIFAAVESNPGAQNINYYRLTWNTTTIVYSSCISR